MKKIVAIFLLSSFVAASTGALAEEKGSVVFRDTAYGVLTGALVGGALALATDEPQDHLGYLGFGAAVGAVGGLAFGLYETTSLASVDESGELHLALPSVQVQPRGGVLSASVDLLRVAF